MHRKKGWSCADFSLPGCSACLCGARVGVPASHATISAHARPNTVIAHAHAAVSPSCLNDPTIGTKVWTVAISGTLAEGTRYTYYSFSVSGNRACLPRVGSGIAVLDVSNPNNPLLIDTYTNITVNSNTMGIQVIENPLLRRKRPASMNGARQPDQSNSRSSSVSCCASSGRPSKRAGVF